VLREAGEVGELSFDHDLGDDNITGYDVRVWLEQAVALRGFKPPKITIHSANVVGRERLERATTSIQRFAEGGRR
jgi:hypothetical protein